jgi:hypothetical protein
MVPATTVVTGDWTVIGRSDTRHEVRPLTFTTGDRVRTYYETRDGEIWNACRRCDSEDPGTLATHRNAFGGRCFQCHGHGLDRRFGTGEAGIRAARRRERKNWSTRQHGARQAQERAASGAAAGRQWRAEHPDLATGLVGLADATATGPLDPTIDLNLYELAHRVRSGKPLNPTDTARAAELLAQHYSAQLLRARQRFAGTIGAELTVTGEVVVATPISSAYGTSMLIVVAGTGADSGITAKTFTRNAAAWDITPGQMITLTGTVRRHDRHNNVPQTVLNRPTITPSPANADTS